MTLSDRLAKTLLYAFQTHIILLSGIIFSLVSFLNPTVYHQLLKQIKTPDSNANQFGTDSQSLFFSYFGTT